VQLLPPDEPPEGVDRIAATPLTDAEVGKVLLGVTADVAPLRDEEDFRISLAGAQEKTALLFHRGRFCKPRGSTPTTHIFKLPLGLVGGRRMDLSASLENEWLCSRLLAGFGIPVAACEVRRFGTTKALVVRRFDRALHSSHKYWLRLPQEDFCQATGTPSSRKYEADGGPGLLEIARILQGSDARDEDLATLLRAQLLFWMLAATDGHAKNWSLRLLAGGSFRLTPVYDVISLWPVVGSRGDQVHPSKLRLAMALHGGSKRYRVGEIRRDHFERTAERCGIDGSAAILDDVVERTPAVIEAVARELPKGFPEEVFASVTKGMRKAAKHVAARGSS
jgi:serine/threonine-protein kinase HipA